MAGITPIGKSHETSSLAGKLLVSAPWMDDPHFARSVILVLAHSDEGAFGVVLNDESSTPTSAVETLIGPAWSSVVVPPESLFVGGPCATESLLALGSFHDPASALPGVAVVDLNAHFPQPDILRIRLFAGYAGWASLQVENEMERGSWFVADALPDDVFSSQPDSLWDAVLERNGQPYARMPKDPAWN